MAQYSKRYFSKKIFYNFQKAASALMLPIYRSRNLFFTQKNVRILMYHSISDFPAERDIPYDNVFPELFEKQMRILLNENFNFMSMGDLVRFLNDGEDFPPKSIAITFDDGYKNNYLHALPILNAMGLRATFFLIAASIGKNEPFKHLLWDEASRKYFLKHPESRLPLNWENVKILVDNGMEIGSHGLTHRSLGRISFREAAAEIIESKKILERNTGNPVNLFSYPFGSKTYHDFNEQTERILKAAGFDAACTSEIGSIGIDTDLFKLPRIPVRETDDENAFRQKLLGAYDWVGGSRRLFQTLFKRIDKVT